MHIDLKSEDGYAIFKRLAERADVILDFTGIRANTLITLQLGGEDLIALARQKLSELKRMLEEHAASGDAGFSAGLEWKTLLLQREGTLLAVRL